MIVCLRSHDDILASLFFSSVPAPWSHKAESYAKKNLGDYMTVHGGFGALFRGKNVPSRFLHSLKFYEMIFLAAFSDQLWK